MKHILKFSLVLIMLAGMVHIIQSCSKIDDLDKFDHFEDPFRLNLKDTVIQLDVQGTEQYTIVTISGREKDFNVVAENDWITVSKGETTEYGKTELTVKISASPNTYYTRTGRVTVSIQDGSKTISKSIRVVQATSLDDPAVSVGVNVLNLSAEQQEAAVAVITNQSTWEAGSTAEWLTFNEDGDSIRIQVQENTGTEAREADISILAGFAPFTATTVLKVIQAKPDTEGNITVEGIEFVFVEGGTFKMGSQNTDPSAPNYGVASEGSHFNANQTPIHNVTLSDYYIGKYTITQAQWEAVMGSNPSKNIGANNPVEYVSYTLAAEFVEKINQLTGKTFRLPTEAEWEYAARGGNKSQGFLYSGGNTWEAFANFIPVADNATRNASRTTPVGSKLPNELGIYDMSGNLYEWCSDYFAPYTATDKVNPTGPATGDRRVMRGGSWWHPATTVYYRGNNTDSYTGNHANAGLTGFRIVYVP